MIERVSRYYDGPLAQVKHKYTGDYTIAVFREFPTDVTYKYIDYVWKDGDSLGELAKNFIGHSKYWWQILEINQLISDPFSIEPGTVIKVPYAN